LEPEVIKISHARTFRLSAARAGAADAPEIESAPDDVVEITLENGTIFWTTRQRLCDELLPRGVRRSGAGLLELPASLPLLGPSRGIVGSVLIKTLRFLKVDIPKFAVQTLARRWEQRTLAPGQQGPGLYRCATTEFGLVPWDSKQSVSGDRPLLLLLHGTASSTQGSFSGLWAPGELQQQLFAPYENNVFGFEHQTLTRNPIDNCIELAELLPAGARLHLISHSRGGMVGELLCRAQTEGKDPFDATDVEFLSQRDPKKERGDLTELNKLLKAKRLRVERFVRVACPARGTTLASERLDLFLSCIFNLLEQIPVFKVQPLNAVLDVFTELIMAIAKERADPSVLPGIEAMIPSSPLVALLNRPDLSVRGELRVIAGDIEGATLSSALGTLLTDPLYRDNHDLVVNTAAMYGGAEREGGAAFSFHQGPEVSHFRYFVNEESRSRLVKVLTRREGEADGFQDFSVRATDSGEPTLQRAAILQPRPVVFLLPGIMGSTLSVGKDRIWVDPADLAFGGMERLSFDAKGVRADSLIWMTYRRLANYLSASHEVVPFPYDWRLSLEVEAKRLAEVIQEKLTEAERQQQPVSILAHSMGGLLARAMIAVRPEVWKRMCQHAEARLIMLGTPNQGSYVIPNVITGRESLMKKLALLDLKHSQSELIAIVCEFPGFLELLPSHGTLDLFSPTVWSKECRRGRC
jgi:pimeloyl-ACP methyl ester carboxylesterase